LKYAIFGGKMFRFVEDRNQICEKKGLLGGDKASLGGKSGQRV